MQTAKWRRKKREKSKKDVKPQEVVARLWGQRDVKRNVKGVCIDFASKSAIIGISRVAKNRIKRRKQKSKECAGVAKNDL